MITLFLSLFQEILGLLRLRKVPPFPCGQNLPNLSERVHLPSLQHDSAQQCCSSKEVYAKPHMCGNTSVPSSSKNSPITSIEPLLVFLNPSLNLLKESSGISSHLSYSSAEGEFQANHKPKPLEKVSPHFSLPQFVSFSLLCKIMVLLDFCKVCLHLII